MKVGELIRAMEIIAPLEFASEWDNVGLLVGSDEWPATRIHLTVDLTEPVLEEAIHDGADVIISYHPPIFEQLTRLTSASTKERIVLRAAQSGIAVYSPHTALDASPGGINDWLANGLGSGDVRSIEPYENLPHWEQNKIVTFCPADSVEQLQNALSTVGAGRIGNYGHCSFQIEGTGTFCGSGKSKPAVGSKEHLERVPEIKLEMVCPDKSLPLAITTIRNFHPYEEPPIEIHPLKARPERSIGHGRRVMLDKAVSLKTIVDRIRHTIGSKRILAATGQHAPRQYSTIGLCAGAGGTLVDSAIDDGCQLFFTGEMRHHNILAAQSRGCTIVLAGHTNTERGYLKLLRRRLMAQLSGISVAMSKRDADPLRLM